MPADGDRHILSATIRAGYPDFLDLPWGRPLETWQSHSARVEDLPRGIGRHPVVFVSYSNRLYVLKELPMGIAEREFTALTVMEERRLPCVRGVGHLVVRTPDEDLSVVITRYLDRSLPYHALFMGDTMVRYRDYLLDAMAVLLVELHLGGVFWGDCSLSNTLFRRDAGRLSAYLVDAETAETHTTLTPGQRSYDLDLMEENLTGGLLDLEAAHALPPKMQVERVGQYVRERYDTLWNEVTREQVLPADEPNRIQDRVRKLNDLGFSVDRIQLVTSDAGRQLRLRASVTDRSFHRDMLHSLTGLLAEELQARTMLNEIEQLKATWSLDENRSLPLSVVAYRWFATVYTPAVARLEPLLARGGDPGEMYCQVLEHKWYMSERAKHDVGHISAADDYLHRYGFQAAAITGEPTPDLVARVSRSRPRSRWRVFRWLRRWIGRVRSG
ncbi:MAG: DUF4032 domain-containing protein [Phycisphaerales bacterium]|nr:DUF4032 domain-containing protein [Phycisphaerales bacterium]